MVRISIGPVSRRKMDSKLAAVSVSDQADPPTFVRAGYALASPGQASPATALRRATTKDSSRLAVIVAQESAKPFVTRDGSIRARLHFLRKWQHVALALMMPLLVIVRQAIVQSAPQTGFAEQDQPGQTLFLDRSHPPLRTGVWIRTARRQFQRKLQGTVFFRNTVPAVTRAWDAQSAPNALSISPRNAS